MEFTLSRELFQPEINRGAWEIREKIASPSEIGGKYKKNFNYKKDLLKRGVLSIGALKIALN
jgi:hypothetical protein